MHVFAVGSYTHPILPSIDPKGAGISIFRHNNDSPVFTVLNQESQIPNPSYLAFNPKTNRLYAVSEIPDDSGTVAAFSLKTTGGLSLQNRAVGPGRAACHLAVSTTTGNVFATSYIDGSVAAYSPEVGTAPLWIHNFEGKGPNLTRQESAHAHQILASPDGQRLFVADLGSDVIWDLSCDGTSLNPGLTLRLPGGYGPRHMVFHPQCPIAYILCELEPRILTAGIASGAGGWEVLQDLAVAELDRNAVMGPAALKIHPSGRSLAVSDRGDNTISVFRIGNRHLPVLERINRFDCNGENPRDIEFSADGAWLYIANQDSHNISCRAFNPVSGDPLDSWGPTLIVGSPVCILMLSN